MAKDLNEPRPLNPFVSTDVDAINDGRLSSIQKRITEFIEDEAKTRVSRTYGLQPPPVKTMGPEAEEFQKEAERKQQEFFEKYKIPKEEHNLLVQLIFYGELNIQYIALGHTFLITDLDPEIRRIIIGIGERARTHRIIQYLKIKAISNTLREIDGVPLDYKFMEQYLWKMQGKTLDLLYKMHLATEKYKIYLYEKLPNFCRTPTSRVRYAICKDLGVSIKDPSMKNLSEEQVYWHYINAEKNRELDNELIKERMDYLTWFINPEMAKKIREKEEMAKEADTNLVQKYSFMNGIVDMIKKDMSDSQISNVMEDIMKNMQGDIAKEKIDPWDEPKPIEGLDPNDPFIQDLKKASQRTKPPEQPSNSEAQVGMFGGNPKWYQK